MKCAIEMDTGGMINIPNFIKIGSGIQKIVVRDTHRDKQTASCDH
jgi:hypothetical protein